MAVARNLRVSQMLLALPLIHALSARGRTWDVVVHRPPERHTVTVAEDASILSALEAEGLLPLSDCRRGNCLSCAARVVAGTPYTLQVSEETALCRQAHSEGVVLLCSASAVGPGVELELDQEWLALEIQHRRRFHPKHRVQPPPAVRAEPPAPARKGYPHFQMPELKAHLTQQLMADPDE
ncbi:hypothetical protein AB1Y20_015773 [Prymnesium parvum]|uniref:2Fe-2S ferredoxin-type domain-containing protein n=1 Tax=Prymnesium parvum TaxID=97485 RepID=A0AB34JZH7_PRYPA